MIMSKMMRQSCLFYQIWLLIMDRLIHSDKIQIYIRVQDYENSFDSVKFTGDTFSNSYFNYFRADVFLNFRLNV